MTLSSPSSDLGMQIMLDRGMGNLIGRDWRTILTMRKHCLRLWFRFLIMQMWFLIQENILIEKSVQKNLLYYYVNTEKNSYEAVMVTFRAIALFTHDAPLKVKTNNIILHSFNFTLSTLGLRRLYIISVRKIFKFSNMLMLYFHTH